VLLLLINVMAAIASCTPSGCSPATPELALPTHTSILEGIAPHGGCAWVDLLCLLTGAERNAGRNACKQLHLKRAHKFEVSGRALPASIECIFVKERTSAP